MKLSTIKTARRNGFSLIEVLIAVVILSVGLLALAALQINIVRSSAEAKARSTALSLAQEKLEQVREFRSRGTDLVGCPLATQDVWPEKYSCIDSGADAAALSVGGTNFTRTWQVSRFVFNDASGTFGTAIGNTATDSAINTYNAANATKYRPGTEFKRVDVNVGWTDAEGNPRTLTIRDSVSAASPSESSRARARQKSGVRRPQVLIRDPSLEDGVIPIAIGGGTDTAATNPRPEIGGRDGDLIETRFDIYTYKGADNDNALVQSRVETVVVGCTCQEGGGVAPGYRPTVWNGNRYVAPEKTGSTPPARHASSTVRAESQYCDVCCRDHHDASFTGPKFSPRRASHSHLVDNSGVYQEACRLIRVDGIMRVAADPYADYFNLLATNNNANDPYPSSAAEGHYQDMVIDYLDNRVVTPSSGYNNAVGNAAVAGFELANSINDPTQISVQQNNASKWLHARGLYFDWLESDAIGVINDAKSNCDLVNSTMEACVLVHVPFTSINLSELSRWGSTAPTEVRVSNGEFKTALNEDDPVRGHVTTRAAAPGDIETVTTEITYTTAGLAVVPAINADDTVASDTQEFRVSGGAPPVGSHVFYVNTTGYTYSNSSALWPTMTVLAPNPLCETASDTSAVPYTCSSNAVVGASIPLVVTGYNYGSSITSNAAITCTGPFADKTYTGSYTVRTCSNYEVSSATGSGAIGPAMPSDGLIDESTTITFPLINNLDTVTLGFRLQGTTTIPSTCTYTCTQDNGTGNSSATDCKNAQKTVFTVVPGECP